MLASAGGKSLVIYVRRRPVSFAQIKKRLEHWELPSHLWRDCFWEREARNVSIYCVVIGVAQVRQHDGTQIYVELGILRSVDDDC